MSSLAEIQQILQQIRDDLPTLLGRSQIAPKQVMVVNGLSDITERLGLVQAGEFRVGNSVEPGLGFTGVRIGYPAFTYNSEEWHIVGVNSDTLQFGLRATDGKAIAGGGVITLDENGITFEAIENTALKPFKFVDSSDVIRGYIYFYDSAGVSTNFYLVSGDLTHALISSMDISSYADNSHVTGTVVRAQSGQTNGHVSLISLDNTSTQANAELRVGKLVGGVLSTYFDFMVNVPDSGQATAVLNDAGHDIDTVIEGDADANLLYVDASASLIGIGTNAPTDKLDINSDTFRLRTSKTPTGTADSSGNTGSLAWDVNYIYVKTGSGWKRAALSTF